MFRYDNPDALLVLLLTASAYATIRALEHGHLRWLALAGTTLGFAFLTKMLQSVLVVPGIALAYGVAAPIAPRRRVVHLLAGLGTFLVCAGWWVALVELWPARSRPYIGDTNLDVGVMQNEDGRLQSAGVAMPSSTQHSPVRGCNTARTVCAFSPVRKPVKNE
jgi:4-amino-4-deoxy-L-arabinose transferase-like glycosyltransferase